jgi:hypothetical protein
VQEQDGRARPFPPAAATAVVVVVVVVSIVVAILGGTVLLLCDGVYRQGMTVVLGGENMLF